LTYLHRELIRQVRLVLLGGAVGEIDQVTFTICSFLMHLRWLVLVKFVRLTYYLEMCEFFMPILICHTDNLVYVEAQFK